MPRKIAKTPGRFRPTRCARTPADSRSSLSRWKLPLARREDSHLGEFIEDKSSVSPSDAAISISLQEQTALATEDADALAKKKVIKMRFGPGGWLRTTRLKEVGPLFRGSQRETHPSDRGESAAQAAPSVEITKPAARLLRAVCKNLIRPAPQEKKDTPSGSSRAYSACVCHPSFAGHEAADRILKNRGLECGD